MTNIELTGITAGLGAMNFAKKLRRVQETSDTPSNQEKIVESKQASDKD